MTKTTIIECKSVMIRKNHRRHWMKPNLFCTLCGRFGWEKEPNDRPKKLLRNCKMCMRIAKHFGYKCDGPLVRIKTKTRQKETEMRV